MRVDPRGIVPFIIVFLLVSQALHADSHVSDVPEVQESVENPGADLNTDSDRKEKNSLASALRLIRLAIT